MLADLSQRFASQKTGSFLLFIDDILLELKTDRFIFKWRITSVAHTFELPEEQSGRVNDCYTEGYISHSIKVHLFQKKSFIPQLGEDLSVLDCSWPLPHLERSQNPWSHHASCSQWLPDLLYLLIFMKQVPGEYLQHLHPVEPKTKTWDGSWDLWHPPGMGHPQSLWAACARASPPTE